ncbi:hypothetical protein [Achromobacter aloeverae]
MRAIGSFGEVKRGPAGFGAGAAVHLAPAIFKDVPGGSRKSLVACLLDAVARRPASVSKTWSRYRACVGDRHPPCQLRTDAREALWDFSMEEFRRVLATLEMRAADARPVQRAMLLAALDIWCELHPLPANRQPDGGMDTHLRRHELRAVLQSPFREGRAPRRGRAS